MIISEKSLAKGIEVDMSNAESKLPNRAIRYNHSAGTNKYELYNYSNNQIDYTFRDLEDLVKLTNRLFQRDDTYVSEVSYHTDTYKKGGEIDLFEDYKKQPKELAEIVEIYEEKYSDGEMDYESTKEFLSKANDIGYTFEYGLDNEPYNLKKMEKGGRLTARTRFTDYDLDRLSYDFVVFDDRVETEDGKVVGTINSKGHLIPKGDKTLKNPLVKWLQQNSYVSNEEWQKLEKGGLTKGKSHKEGGIPMKVKDTGQDIEVEGGEIIVNKYSSSSNKKNKFNGKELTNCEVISEINEQDGKGVKIDCDSVEGKKYKHQEGGKLAKGGTLNEYDKVSIKEKSRIYKNYKEDLSKDKTYNVSWKKGNRIGLINDKGTIMGYPISLFEKIGTMGNPLVMSSREREIIDLKSKTYAEGGVVWKKNIGDDGWSSTMENESAYDNEGGYISESGNWKIFRQGRWYYDKWQERENFKRDGDWRVMGMNEYGRVEDFMGEFETLIEAKKYVERWININPKDYEKGGDIDGDYIYPENSLGLEKSYLPQIRTNDKALFIKYLEKRYGEGIAEYDRVSANQLNPVQNKINPLQIRVIENYGGLKGNKTITISKDNYVVDGHHRWYYAKMNGLDLPVLRVNLKATDLIAESFLSGLAQSENIDSIRKAHATGGIVSKDYLNKKIPTEIYKSIFADTDRDGVANVDDVAPFNKDVKERIEEISLKDEIKALIDYRNEFEQVREELVEDLEEILSVCEGKGDCGILSRTKTPYSIVNKLRRRGLTNTKDLDKLDKKAKRKLKNKDLTGLDLYKGLTDVVGAMIVTPTKADSDKVKDAILEGKAGEVLEFEDFYKNTKDGYRAYHFLVAVTKNNIKFPVEIQVKTKRIKQLSDIGHTAYKRGSINTSNLNKLMQLANRGDKGSKKAQAEFNGLMQKPQKVLNMITSQKIYKKGGYADAVKTEEMIRDDVEQYIPSSTKIDFDLRGKIDYPYLYKTITSMPSIYDSEEVDDSFDKTAYLHYYNEVGTHFFVAEKTSYNDSGNRDGDGNDIQFRGLRVDEDDSEASFGSQIRMVELDEDFLDDMLNWKLDYDFIPQSINGAFKVVGLNKFMTKDIKVLAKDFGKMDFDRIINKQYENSESKNNAIKKLLDWNGDNLNDYDVDTQNFISSYVCGSFRAIMTPKLQSTMVGMIYQNILNKDIEINNSITLNACKGEINAWFPNDVDVLGVESEETPVRIANLLNTRDNSYSVSPKMFLSNPPDTQKDSGIFFADNFTEFIGYLDYIKRNGIIVALCYVIDFEDYFSSSSDKKNFLKEYKLENVYRISADNLLLHIQKK
jgi:ppGpp synthetase/RelA/SpoT-type nucleotidyltranferase